MINFIYKILFNNMTMHKYKHGLNSEINQNRNIKIKDKKELKILTNKLIQIRIIKLHQQNANIKQQIQNLHDVN